MSANSMSGYQWDIFISHASEDKDFVAPLAEALHSLGIKVWYDDYIITLGDSLSQTINDGLSRSQFGVIVISPHFLKKQWTIKELNGLMALETSTGTKRILPVWHGITQAELLAVAPILADKKAIDSSIGFEKTATEIVRTIGKGTESPANSSSQHHSTEHHSEERVRQSRKVQLPRISTGRELVDLLAGADLLVFQSDDARSEEEATAIAAFNDMVEGFDVRYSQGDKARLQHDLKNHIAALLSHGLFMYGARTPVSLHGKDKSSADLEMTKAIEVVTTRDHRSLYAIVDSQQRLS